MGVVVLYAATEESEAALDFAISEAERRQAPLHVLLTGAGATAVRLHLENEGNRLAKWLLHEAQDQQSPAHAVLDLATEVDAALVVVGTRRRSPVGKLLLGSLAQEILLGADMPVVLVKPQGK